MRTFQNCYSLLHSLQSLHTNYRLSVVPPYLLVERLELVAELVLSQLREPRAHRHLWAVHFWPLSGYSPPFFTQ